MIYHMKLNTYQTIEEARADNPKAYQVTQESSGWIVFETESDFSDHLTQMLTSYSE